MSAATPNRGAPDLRVRFNGVDVGAATRDLTASTSIHDLPSAEFVLDLDAVPGQIVDYLAEVRIAIVSEGGREDLIFTGRVVSATPTSTGVVIECRGGVALDEQRMPPLGTWNVRGADLIHLIARSAGFSDDRLRIDGLEELPAEAFEVAAPITGITLPSRIRFGPVELVPATDAERFFVGIRPPAELRDRFMGGDAFCVACVTARTIFDAERAGLADIEMAVSWLCARARYGLARLPAGEPITFRRAHALGEPTFIPLVIGFGMKTDRRWMRVPTNVLGGEHLPLDAYADLPAPTSLTLQERHALLAFRRAATEDDPLERVTALWEAIEFYVAGSRAERLFTDAQLRAIAKSVDTEGLTPRQRQRVQETLAGLNSAPLFTRLRARIDGEGVPLTESELHLLQRLRKLRNDAAHGRERTAPDAEEIEHAVSVVSRMLMFRFNAAPKHGAVRSAS